MAISAETFLDNNLQAVKLGGKDLYFHSSLADAVSKADADMRAGGGKGLNISSSFRTKEQQEGAYNRYKSGQGGLAAKPGSSRHEKGLAVDISNWKEAAPYLKKYGLVNPFVQKGDPVHFQFPGVPGAYKPKPPATPISAARNMTADASGQVVPPEKHDAAWDLLQQDRQKPTSEVSGKPTAPAQQSAEDFLNQYKGKSAEEFLNNVAPQPQGQPKPGGQPAQPEQAEEEPGFFKRAAKAVAPYSKHALPFAGAAAGGLVAAPANLVAPGVAEAAGIALGGAAGIQAQRMLENYAGIKQPETQGEKYYGKQAGPIADAATDVTSMMGLGALAPGLLSAKPGLQVFGSPEAKAVTQRAAKAAVAGAESAIGRKALSQETKVPLTPAQTGQAKSVTYVEAQLRKNMWSADEVAAFDEEQRKALQDYSLQVQKEKFGGPNDPTSAGTAVKESAWSRISKFRQRGSKLYGEVPVDPKTPIETQKLSDTAKEHLDELGKFESPAVKRILGLAEKSETPAATSTSPILDASGRPITTETPPQPTYTWEQLRGDQSALGKLIERTSDPNQKRILGNLVRAITDDIGTFAKTVDNPEIKAKLDQANKYWRHGEGIFGPARTGVDLPGMQTWGMKQIKRLLKEESPEKIGATFFKARPNRTEIRALKEAAGEEGFKQIQQSWFEDMITKGEEGTFNHNRFITAYNKYRQSGNLDEMLTKSQKEGIDKLYQISKTVAWSERVAGNPSGTGHMVINELRKLGHPVRAVAQILGTKKFAQNYFNNPEFQKKMVAGLKLPSASIRARAIAKQLMTIGGVEEREQLR